MKTELNSQSMLKIQALAIYDHELFDAMMDISYALHLLETGNTRLQARYGVNCGDLMLLPCNEFGLRLDAWSFMVTHERL